MNAVFKTLSDDKTGVLFHAIALSGSSVDAPISKRGLTRKQYYSRLHSLITSGLIIRRNGKYPPTSMGFIVSFYRSRIKRALDSFWKLKALDSISEEANNDLRIKKFYPNLVSSLIEDVEIREILRNTNDSSLGVKPQLLQQAKCQAIEKSR